MHISQIIGSLKKYQLWICFLIFINKFGIAFHQMAIIFLAPPVKYFCPGSNSTCCEKPVYNKSVFSRTITMEWHLICEKSWLKDFTQTVFQFGVLLGSLLCGMASDRFGRRKTLIFCVIVEVFTGLMAAFVPDFWSFTIVRSFLGFSVGGMMVVGFVILMEYVGQDHRYIISALFHVPFTTGHVLLALFGYLIRDYVYFQLGISLANIILLSYICLLPESPRWLLAVNKTTEAVAILERIAKINKMPVDTVQQQIDLYQLEHKSRREKKGYAWDLFRTPNLRKNIIIMSFMWLVTSYYFYGVSYYISHLTGDLYVNVAACGSVCIGSCFLGIPLMKFFERKTIVMVSYVACSLCLLLIAVIPEGVGSTVLGCTGLLFSFLIFVVAYLYCSEMFPTVVRNSALGIASMMARLGAMIAPFSAALGPYGKWCAPVAFGVLPFVAAVLCYWLPETKGCELMMTLEEAENFGKNLLGQKMSLVPVRELRNDYNHNFINGNVYWSKV